MPFWLFQKAKSCGFLVCEPQLNLRYAITAPKDGECSQAWLGTHRGWKCENKNMF
jgi:hypothetical protein